MKSIFLTSTLILLTALSPLYAQHVFKGVVKDKESGEILPLVNIRLVNSDKGTTANSEGEFVFNYPEKQVTLVFSFVGYQTQQRTLNLEQQSYFTVLLESSSQELDEVVFKAGENPAHIILRRALARRQENNFRRLPAYQYLAYNKVKMSTRKDTSTQQLVHPDSTKQSELPPTEQDSTVQIDSVQMGIDQFLKTHHLFISESIIERKYRYPNKINEKVLATKMSGYKDPMMTAMSTNYQPVPFYKEYLRMYDRSYLNPFSKGSHKRYDLELADTLFTRTDSIYVIKFQPKKQKGFYGFGGKMHISTDGYAIQYFEGDFYDPEALMNISWKQTFERVNRQHWFPVSMEMKIDFRQLDMLNQHMLMEVKSFFTQHSFPEKISNKEFGVVTLNVADSAGQRSDNYWNLYRVEPLQAKDANTYRFLDSVSEKAGIHKLTKLYRALMTQRYPIGKVDVMINRLVAFNNFEGFAPGLGLATNQKLSTFFNLNGWFRYGFKDKNLKYGGRLKFNWNRRLDFFTSFSYRNDLLAAGQVAYDLDHRPWGNIDEGYRNLFVERMEQLREVRMSTGIRPVFLPVNFFLQLSASERSPLYNYAFGSESTGLDSLNFRYSEATLGMSYYHKERHMRVDGRKLHIGYRLPVVNLLVTKGFEGPLNGEFDYWKMDVRLKYAFSLKGIGRTYFGIYAGKIFGDVPYGRLYVARADGMNSMIHVPNIFQTAGYYEFASSEYANLYFIHNFGRLIHRSPTFRPELLMMHNLGYSRIHKSEQHHELQFEDMSKGFYESGLLIENLYRFNYFDVMYIGLGGGAFMRYGPYMREELKDNVAYKISIKMSY